MRRYVVPKDKRREHCTTKKRYSYPDALFKLLERGPSASMYRCCFCGGIHVHK
jgi:hypothetical protein